MIIDWKRQDQNVNNDDKYQMARWYYHFLTYSGMPHNPINKQGYILGLHHHMKHRMQPKIKRENE